MSEPDNFLARWSRRKQEAAAEKAGKPEPPVAAPHPTGEKVQETEKPAERAQSHQESTFDISKLPPLESIGPGTDIRPFLAKGVPSELSRAALRRAWVADPEIRDFVGLAENAWDFTKPETIPGFGSLDLSDEVRQAMVDQFLGTPSVEKSAGSAVVEGSSRDELTSSNPVPSAETAESKGSTGSDNMRITEEYKEAAPSQSCEAQQLPLRQLEDVAVQDKESSDQYDGRSTRRRHGGALPT